MGTPSDTRRWRRAARFLAWSSAAIVVLAAAAILVLPQFLDTPAVRAGIERKLSEAIHGRISWDSLQIRLFPSPRGVLKRVQVDIPEVTAARAEQVDASLAFWPLLHGRAEITAIGVARPEIRVEIRPAPAEKKGKPVPTVNPVEMYRTIAGEIATIVRKFAPDTMVTVGGGRLEIHAAGMPPLELHDFSARVRSGQRGMHLELETAGNHWSRVKLAARLDFDDLSAKADLEATGIKPQVWLDRFVPRMPTHIAVPAADLRAQLHSDGMGVLQGELDLRARSLRITRAAESVHVPDFAVKGKVTADSHETVVHLNETRLGASRLTGATLRLVHAGKELAVRAGFDLDVAEGMEHTRRLLPEKAGAALKSLQPAAGRAQGHVTIAVRHAHWNIAVDVGKSDATVRVGNLPGPVGLAGAAVDITRDAVKIERAALSLLDSRVLATARVAYKGPQVEVAVSEGAAGPDLLAWAWRTGGVPLHLEVKTPVRVEAPRIAWSPGRPLEVQAMARMPAGQGVAVELGWTRDMLDIRRAALKDERTDATFTLRVRGRALEGSFSGSLHSASIAALLKNAQVPSGNMAGGLRFRYDRDNPRRATAEGKLRGESLDLAWLLRRPVTIDRVELAGDQSAVRVRELAVNWAGQRATMRGEVRQAASGLVFDAQLDSPGINVDALIAPGNEAPAAKPPATGASQPADLDPSHLWPLPVTGKLAVRSDFVIRGRYRVAPFAGTLLLEEQRAKIDLRQAQLCGISLPLALELTPRGLVAAARISAQKQQLEQTAHCLTDQRVLITGEFDLTADITSRGQPGDFARNLEGTVTADAHDGRVMKFALLGNILSMSNIAALMKEGGPKLDAKGFPYRSVKITGRFEKGRFLLDEGAFRSDAVGLAASGWISLVQPESRLTVLVAPFSRLDQFARSVPIVGYIVGGAFTSVPVGVSGDIRDPLVVPLGPGAITSEVLGIFERTLKLPVKLVSPAKE